MEPAIIKRRSENLSEFRNQRNIYHVLRIASAMCFIGHGAFGIITKAVWCNYFALFGIAHDLAYRLMPLVGSFDILFGMSLLVYPTRAVLSWLVIWGFATASMRPLSGESFAELIERAGNFGAPLALLLLCPQRKGLRNAFSKMKPAKPVNVQTIFNVKLCLRIVAFFLFLGHGILNLIGKKGFDMQYTALGFSHPANVALTLGIFEIATAFTVLFRPRSWLIIILIVWKMTSEIFYPHYELFEWIERGGSYGVLIALFLASRAYSGSPLLFNWWDFGIRGVGYDISE